MEGPMIKAVKRIEKKVVKRVEAAMAAPLGTSAVFSCTALLSLLSKLYGLAVTIRLSLYRLGILKSRTLPCFVLSIGNITAGGTGKTPMTLYAARLVKKLGYTAAVVSRGYKGAFEEKGGIVSTGKKIVATADQAGDEPYMLATTLNIPVVVGKNRYKAAMTAVEEFHPDVVILDDAFQHLAVKRDLNLLLLDCTSPFGNNALLPRGPLREPLSALNRSDAVVLTPCPGQDKAGAGEVRPGPAKNHSGETDSGAFGNGSGRVFHYEGMKDQVGVRSSHNWFRTSHVPFVCRVVDENGLVLNREEQEVFFPGENGQGFSFQALPTTGILKPGVKPLASLLLDFLSLPIISGIHGTQQRRSTRHPKDSVRTV